MLQDKKKAPIQSKYEKSANDDEYVKVKIADINKDIYEDITLSIDHS